eukprot:4380139-Amphidinium_carterae.1
MLYRAKREHLHSYDWNEGLTVAFRDAKRSLMRGVGPPRQSAPLAFERVASVPHTVLNTGVREIELSCAAFEDMATDPRHQTVSWRFPASKNDVEGFTVTRSWGCLCGSRHEELLCPFHTAESHLEMLRKMK